MISIENGEQCPYCDLVMKDSLIGGEGILTHMDQNHKDKMLDVLFPEKPSSDDEYADSNDVDSEDVALGYSIVKSNDEVSGVFMRNGKIIDIDYLDGEGEAMKTFEDTGEDYKIEIIEQIFDEGAK
jgi:hypothetical protein